ncbi:MAG: LysR substrate-binding domain-containing protein [Oceanospirillaceae bacterium]
MNRFINPDLLQTFIAIAEEGSFQRAALRVNRTQSTVSMQIQRLEQLLGNRLFTRQRPHTVLTYQGEVVLGYARRIMELQHEVWEALAEPKAVGVVRFGIPDDYASGILPHILERFAQIEPQIEVSVHCATSVQLSNMIIDGDLDLAVISRRSDGPKGDFFKQESLVWVSSLQHATHSSKIIPLAVFQEDCVIRQAATRALKEIGQQYRIAYSSPNLAALHAVTSAGLAIAVMPKSSVPSSLRILDKRDGFPELPKLELGLIRSVKNSSAAQEALALCICPRTDISSAYIKS